MTDARGLGRMAESDWIELKMAAAYAGNTFTDWAVGELLAAAEREAKLKRTARPEPRIPRQLGRVSAADWDTITAAAERAGEDRSTWAIRRLLAAAAKAKRARERKRKPKATPSAGRPTRRPSRASS